MKAAIYIHRNILFEFDSLSDAERFYYDYGYNIIKGAYYRLV